MSYATTIGKAEEWDEAERYLDKIVPDTKTYSLTQRIEDAIHLRGASMNSGMNVAGPLNDEYETPEWLFQALDTEFGFTLDPASTHANAKCKKHYTAEENGLLQPWAGERVFCNPPYSQIEEWLWRPADYQVGVFLLPLRGDNDWFIRATEQKLPIRWYRKRVGFLLNGVPAKSPRFASLLVIRTGDK